MPAAPTMMLGLIPVPRPSELRLEAKWKLDILVECFTQKANVVVFVKTKPSLSFHNKKVGFVKTKPLLTLHKKNFAGFVKTKPSLSTLSDGVCPQDNVSADSCSTSTVSGSHDSDSPSWLREADYDADYEFDCDHAGVVNKESYTEFDHDRMDDFEEVLEALSVLHLSGG